MVFPAYDLTRYPPSEHRALLSERTEQATVIQYYIYS